MKWEHDLVVIKAYSIPSFPTLCLSRPLLRRVSYSFAQVFTVGLFIGFEYLDTAKIVGKTDFKPVPGARGLPIVRNYLDVKDDEAESGNRARPCWDAGMPADSPTRRPDG